jgi:hypothetical protein
MIELGYLVTAWAGSAQDEHQLLGDVLSRFAAINTIPEEYLPGELSSSVYLTVGEDERNRPREIWTATGGSLKASFTLEATVAADTFDWLAEAPLINRVEGLAAPRPR